MTTRFALSAVREIACVAAEAAADWSLTETVHGVGAAAVVTAVLAGAVAASVVAVVVVAVVSVVDTVATGADTLTAGR